MNFNPRSDPLTLPIYDDLPRMEGIGLAHSWNVYGKNDEFGTLNNIDNQVVVASLTEATTGERIGLTLPTNAINPPLYQRQPLRHTFIPVSRNIWDDKLDDFYPQASSQWDGFRHVRCREFGFYGGVTLNPSEMGTRLGIQSWAESGIIGRGVLLDVERHLVHCGQDYDPLSEISVTPELLAEVAKAQNVEIRKGDILCIRFGWINRYRSLSKDARVAYASTQKSPPYAGLSADEETARQLWNWQISAVACDNPGAEVSPGNPEIGSLHRRLIPGLGMVIGELMNFEILSQRCVQDNRWTFLFVAVPTNIVGGVGSSANAVAIR